jgi:hypothetical protein
MSEPYKHNPHAPDHLNKRAKEQDDERRKAEEDAHVNGQGNEGRHEGEVGKQDAVRA